MKKEIEKIIPQAEKWYKHLHQNPELSFQEEETSKYIYEELNKMEGLDEVIKPTKTSVMVKVKGKEKGETVAIRADIDALPILEETEVEYKSKKDGIMHACGHDAHTTMLLSTVKIVAGMKDKIKGEVRFLFQHAEELPPGGAIEMLKAGVMEGVDKAFAIHVLPNLKTGTFGYKEGIYCAAADIFEIKIIGKGMHASSPHLSVDPIIAGATIINNLQSIISRNIDPLDNVVLSLCCFKAGTTYNIIPEEAVIKGTLRTLKKDVREKAKAKIFEIAENSAKAFGTQCEIMWQDGYAVGHNDVEVTKIFVKATKEIVGEENVINMKKPTFGGEDFTIFQEHAKGSMLWLGIGNSDKQTEYALHSPKFKMDLDALQYGIGSFVNVVKHLCMK